MPKEPSPIDAQDEWEIICSPDRFDALRGDPSFPQLLALARLLNALRYVQCAASRVPKSKLRATRHRINTFLTMGALLFEGMSLVRRMGRHYRALPSWQQGLGAVLRDQRFGSLIENLKKARNQVVFHVFEDEFTVQLREWKHDGKDVKFVLGRGRNIADTYHDLADSMAMQTFVGPVDSEAEFRARFIVLAKTATDFTIAFLRAADRAIFEALRAKGFKIRRHRQRSRAKRRQVVLQHKDPEGRRGGDGSGAP